MTRHILACALLALVAMDAFAVDEWGQPGGPNLLTNPGFEEVADGRPVGWGLPQPVYSLQESDARTGERCLKYVNDEGDRYVMARQDLDLVPGALYEVKASVRTQGLSGDDSGATVCLEWEDAEGKYLGGYYVPGRKGDTAEWTEVGGTSNPLPDEAASAHILCYVRKGMTGTAWWDDVSVRRVRRRPLSSFLVSPSYRGIITADGPPTAEVRVGFTWHDVPGGRQACALVARVTSAGNERALAEQTVDALPEDELVLRVALPDLAEGDYDLTLALTDRASGETVAEEVHRLRRRARMPANYVDAHGRMMIDGEPFFPLGMYWSGIREDELQTYADSAFNCLMPYGRPEQEQMDLAHAMGLKVIYSVKDFYYGTRWCPDFIESEADEEPAVLTRVREFGDHPALLAWYINDELPLSMLPRLRAHQRWIEEADPDHPTWVVLYQVSDVAAYAGSFDVIGTDPYPLPQRAPAMAGEWARLTREAVRDARALWMVPQVFAKRVYEGRPGDLGGGRAPTYDEMRSMAWQCICEGADGLIFYSWFDMRRDTQEPFEQRWPEMKRIAAEIADAAPVLLSVEPVPDIRVDVPDAVHWTARRHDGAVHVFLVNDSTEPVRATLHVGDAPIAVDLPPLGVSIRRVAP